MCYFHHNLLYAWKNTILLLNISRFFPSALEFSFLLSYSFSTLEFHHVSFVCLILSVPQLLEFSHILFQDRRVSISDFRAIRCKVLKKGINHFSTDKEYVPCQGLLVIMFQHEKFFIYVPSSVPQKNAISLLIFCLFENLFSLKWTWQSSTFAQGSCLVN